MRVGDTTDAGTGAEKVFLAFAFVDSLSGTMAPVTVSAGIAAAHHATTLIKGIAEALKASGKSEMLSNVLDLQMAMVDLVQKQQELVIENGSLRVKILELEKALQYQGELIRDGNALYRASDEKREEPYCMACWGHDHKLVPMSFRQDVDGTILLRCRICDGRKKD